MTNNNKKVLFIGIGAIIVVIIAIIILVTSMQKTGLNDSFFISDGTKYVIPIEGDEISITEGTIRPAKKYVVYYYQGDTITDAKEYYLYNSTADAKKMYQQLKENAPANYQAIAIDGKYVILTASSSAYEGKTATEIKQYIEFLNDMQSPDDYSSTEYEEFDEEGNTIESDDDSELEE